MTYYDKRFDRYVPTSCPSAPSREDPSRSLPLGRRSRPYSNQGIHDVHPREYGTSHSPWPRVSSSPDRKVEKPHQTESDGASLAVGGIALIGLIAVPASYLSVWLAAAGLELAGVMASFTVATSVTAAPYLVAGGAAYGTLQGGKVAVKKGTPYVIAVVKDARQRADDIRKLVAVMRQDQIKRFPRPDAAAASTDSDVRDSHPPAQRLALPKFISNFLSRPSKNIPADTQLLTFEQAVQHQQEQQRNGTADAFDYFAFQLHDDAGENDLSNPWLRIDKDDTVLPIGELDDDEWVDVMRTAPSPCANLGPPDDSTNTPAQRDEEPAQSG